MIHDFDPPRRPATGWLPGRRSRAEFRLACPLVFSVTGLMLDVAASFGGSNDPQMALLRLALIAGAPALAAIAAIEIDGDGASS
jgi:hypothetical protein